MDAVRLAVKPILMLNAICLILAGVGTLLGIDFQTLFFLSMMTVTAFALLGAGVEDISMTPTGSAIRRALLKTGPPYSPARHKEALESANRMIAVGGILFAEVVGVSLAITIFGL